MENFISNAMMYELNVSQEEIEMCEDNISDWDTINLVDWYEI